MRGKTDEHQRQSKHDVPSTGQGAASALDALIKKRVPMPASPAATPAPAPSQKH